MSGMIVLAGGAVFAALASWWGMRAFVRADPAPVSPRGPLMAAGAAALAVLGLYLLLGDPFLRGGAYADRMAALKHKAPEAFTVEEAIAVLEATAKQRPADAQPLILLGDLEARVGRPERALTAFQEALRRAPQSAPALIGLGRVLVARDRGEVRDDARSVFGEAAALDPDAFEPPFYLALAAYQRGESAAARTLWLRARERTTPDDPRRAMIDRMLEQP
ncbi:MAG: tetratricopeptide repeat protein [Alphaproteobacteria bacterium]|nr:tetratricopeptide repeat protein [Alphaproteobacteria bacterium]